VTRALQWDVAVAAVATLLIAALHLGFFRHAGPLWRDEINSVQLATEPSLSALGASLRYDSFPALLPLTLRGWSALVGGASDGGFRVFGLLVGVATLGALWFTAWEMSAAPPLLSLALFAASPLAIRIGDSIRPYGLGTFFLVLLLGLVRRALRRSSGRFLAAAALAAIASMQCSYGNAVLVLAICCGGIVVTLGRGDRRGALCILGAGVAAALSVLPYWESIQTARDWSVVMQRPLDAARILDVLGEALSSSRMIGPAGRVVFWVWVGLYALALPAVLATLVRSRVSAARKDSLVFATVVVVVATLGSCLFVRLASLFSQPWYFLPMMAVAALALECIVRAVATGRTARVVEAALAVALLAVVLPPVRGELQRRQTNVDLVATALARDAAAGDLVLVDPWYLGVSLNRYYAGTAPWTTVPPLADHRIHRYDLLKQALAAERPIAPLLDAVARTLESGGSVWVVGTIPLAPPGESVPDLPPAPNGGYGWSEGAYVTRWGQQIGRLLQSKATAFETIRLPFVGPINSYENVDLGRVRGARPR
jgi:hypothetical protein